MYDVPVSFHFAVNFGAADSGKDARFQEVTGLSAEVTTEEYREGGQNGYAHRLPTGAKYANLVLKRGLIHDSEISEWFRQAVENFVFEPKEITVSLLDESQKPLVTWGFEGAYPVKWSLSDFKAQESALAIETLELAYRSFRRS